MKAPIEICPYCGSIEGYYTKEQVRGHIRVCHNFDGSNADNADMYDGLTFTGGKIPYCLDCNKQLFKTSESTLLDLFVIKAINIISTSF